MENNVKGGDCQLAGVLKRKKRLDVQDVKALALCLPSILAR